MPELNEAERKPDQPIGGNQRWREEAQISPEAVIGKHWDELNHAPGQPVSGLETFASGYRIRYSNGGAIYLDKVKLNHPAWVYGSIGEHYDRLGGPTSWLGLPTADEAPFSEDGRVSTFRNGAIYWWPDTGAIALNDVVVEYTGLICFGETDMEAADEPYVLLAAASAQGPTSVRSQIYEGVKAIQGRPDLIEIYRGKPYGVAVSATLMEHDLGDPDRYKAALEQAAAAAAGVLTAAVGLVATPLVAGIIAPLLGAAAPAIGDALNDLIGTGDDHLGTQTLPLTAKRMVVLAGQQQDSVDYGVTSRLQTPLFGAQGSSYKLCFRVAPA